MRPLIFAALACLCAPSAIAQANIRQVDFKNFSYPLKDHLLGHDQLRWLSADASGSPRLRTIRLRDGEDLEKFPTGEVKGQQQYEVSGFTLQDVKYADLTGDGKEDSIVVLLYRSGGTQTTNYIYIYALDAGKPKLLAYCHTGSRADSGLYAAYGQHGMLVIELLDSAKQMGDCCSSGYIRTRYRWSNGRFQQVGKPSSA